MTTNLELLVAVAARDALEYQAIGYRLAELQARRARLSSPQERAELNAKLAGRADALLASGRQLAKAILDCCPPGYGSLSLGLPEDYTVLDLGDPSLSPSRWLVMDDPFSEYDNPLQAGIVLNADQLYGSGRAASYRTADPDDFIRFLVDLPEILPVLPAADPTD